MSEVNVFDNTGGEPDQIDNTYSTIKEVDLLTS